MANKRLAKKGDMVVIEWKETGVIRKVDYITITEVVGDKYKYMDCHDFTEGDFPESSLRVWLNCGMAQIIKCDKVKKQ